MIYLIILVAVIVAIFFIPLKVQIYIKSKGKNVYYVDSYEKKHNNIAIKVKILGIFTIFKYVPKNNKYKKEKKKVPLSSLLHVVKENEDRGMPKISEISKKILKLIKRIQFNKFVLVFGFNTEDYIKNTYLNASINTIMCMIINSNQKNFDLNNLYYQVSISNYNYYITLNSIIRFSLVHNIDVIFSILSYVLKINKSIKKIRRVDKYGRTSDRKFNDNSNEFA